MNERLKFFAAILPFLAVTVYALGFMNFATDEYSYMNTAYSFTSNLEKVDWPRFPLLPFLMAPFYMVFGASDIVSRLFIMFLGVLTLAAVYLITGKMFGRKTAWWAALITASSPLFVFFGTRVLAEMLFMLIFFVCIYMIYLSKSRPKYLAAFGFLSALLFLARYTGLLVFLVLVVYLMIEKKGKLIFSRWFLVSIGVFFLTVSPYLLVSYQITGNPFGLVLEFLMPRYASPDLEFGLPDRIPSFFVMLPFVLGAASPLLWCSVHKMRRKLLAGKPLLFSAAALVAALSLEVFYLQGTPLVRYLVVVIPLLAVLSAFSMKRKKIEYVGVVLVALNLVASFYLVYEFNTGYQKHIDYRTASIYAAENCSTYYSNIEYAIFFHTKKLGIGPDENPECIIISRYVSSGSAEIPQGYSRITAKGLSDKIAVFRKG